MIPHFAWSLTPVSATPNVDDLILWSSDSQCHIAAATAPFIAALPNFLDFYTLFWAMSLHPGKDIYGSQSHIMVLELIFSRRGEESEKEG